MHSLRTILFLQGVLLFTHSSVQGAVYVGCYADTNDRDLPDVLIRYSGNTPQKCINLCKTKGFMYAAVQAGYACLCGNSYGKHGSISESKCQVSCSGDKTQTCGGLWANAIYNISQPGQDPCTSYQAINEPLRSAGYVVAKNVGYDQMICDRLLTQGWYRFTSGAGGEMPTTCPPLFHCGTHIPIWLNGAHPTVAEGTVTRNTCGHQPGTGCCGIKGSIQVKNCGTFYVYNLKPTRGCSMAHCAGTKAACPPDKWSPTGFEPVCKDAYPKLTQNPSLSNPIPKPDTFEFNCHVNYNTSATDVGFDVTWLFDGKPDPNVPRTHMNGSVRDSSIDQKYLVGHLGEELSCRADAFYIQSPGRKSPPISSNGYWMGIKLSEPRLEVGEHEKPKEVKLISTIPIICDKQNQQSCHLEVYLEPNNHDFKTTTSCTVTLKPTDWNPVTNQAVAKFEVLAERDFKHDHDKNLVMHFSRIQTGDAPPVFNNYEIPYLQVITKDKPTGLCSCVGDPHCITLDHSPSTSPILDLGRLWHSQRRYMYDFFKLGEFVMYKSTVRPFEVQVRNWQCGRATCICAVTAREGNDVIRIDICHGRYGHTFPKVTIPNKGSFSQGTVIQKDRSGNKYVISFPSGATVTVVNVANKQLDVYVNAPEDDYQHTQGLCGTFDGRRDNDQTGKDGRVHHWSRRPDSFVESWRVPVGSSMFDKPPQPDPKYNNDLHFCNCNQAKKQVDCKIENKASRPALHTRCPRCSVILPQKTGQSGRKKRSTGIFDTGNDTDINYFFDYGLFSQVPTMTDFPTPSGLTEANATKLCTDALQQSHTVSQCVSHAGLNFFNEIGSCIEDLRLTDDLSFVQSAVQTAIISCQEYILKNLTFYNNATGEPPAFITTDLCPSDCSGRGACVNGTCICHGGYLGDACAIDSRKSPSLFSIVSSSRPGTHTDNCDIQKRTCQKLYIVGNNIMEHNASTCHLKELQFDNGYFVPSGKSFETPMEFESMYNVLCYMPDRSQVQNRNIIGYNISLSNNGHNFSNELQIYIIDSACMSCSNTGGHCSIKPYFCLIDGVCRQANEQKSGDPTQFCKPGLNNNQWTPLHPTTLTRNSVSTPTTALAQAKFTTKPSEKTTTSATTQVTQAKLTTKITDKITPPVTTKPQGPTKPSETITPHSTFPTQTVTSSVVNMTGTSSITQWYFAHLPPALPGGQFVPRFDIWTLTSSGCSCPFNASNTDCACCDVDGCQCPGSNQYQCVQCGHTENCGTYWPSPEKGIDGYTVSFSNCTCAYNPDMSSCACCQNTGCQCGEKYRNQCVKCGHLEQCGIKPWIFGPPFNTTG